MEYNILLGTGGPALRIIGDLGEHHISESAHLEYQDWFTPWEQYYLEAKEERQAVLAYAQQFYYGEQDEGERRNGCLPKTG